jgi:sterol desaturase/sphingolipid hydroxylase (fatty acid hydroxylase superfamily)
MPLSGFRAGTSIRVDWGMASDSLFRLGFFIGLLIPLILWELSAPRRSLTTPKSGRWFNNMGIVILNTAALRAIFPVLAVDISFTAQQNGWGLLNNYHMPYWIAVVIGVISLDLVIYLQHVMFHTVPVLWRLHMVHHADLDIDVSTGLRFHPIEIALSMLVKMGAVAVIGHPAVSVIIFEVALNATSMFNHGNIRMPAWLDGALRLIVVTPDMHRVHHSVAIRETNSNFGFNFPWWDRFFGTYRAQPAAGHTNMVIGLAQFRNPGRLSLPWLLILPFVGDTGAYAINRRGREPDVRNR